jgi:hypothetical protein
MVYLLSGLAVLTVVLIALRGFTSANPAVIARQLRFVGGALLMAVAAGLALRGRIDLALLIGFAGWGLLMGRGVLPWGSGGWGSGGPGGAGQGSRVSTDHLEMELDHATGAIRGTVRKGRFAGQEIETLSPAELVLLWQDYTFADPNSAQIVEAYLDQRHPTWRDDLERQGGGGRDEAYEGEARPPPASRGMTRAEALEILGLQEGATDEAVRSAHRELMKKLHPDRGGSNYLASKINEAKVILVGD